MGKCVIFCAALFSELLIPIETDDYIIAADGGLRHTEKLGLTPHMVIGDFDSLGYIPRDATVFPVEKDDTDSMLAIRKGLEMGYRTFLLYGSLDGPRLDHTVANFQALAFLRQHGARGYLIGERQIVTLMENESLVFPNPRGDFSVFCMGAPARGITLTGFHYPLTDGTLTADFPLGVSNHFTQSRAEVRVEKGQLLLIYSREAGLPEVQP